ncbi:LysM peptidoglycan-binding domain-containing protein [Pararhodobacter sp. SW119]|uniref:LysM peptidoglycan-binding domain-containing protein n=1 Tax=Pararhodobacter sp. SW119 TaxID=2780075 RepID=UPI001ADF59CB|nr:LysM peptidoglycan-binding domain-containing protein [Pararhodobacter sp. SW119]
MKWFPRILVVGILAATAHLGVPQVAIAQAFDRCGDAVRIQPGDTLYRVARYCGVTIAELMAANPRIYDPDAIRVGQLVHMPGRRGAAVPRGPAPPEIPPAATGPCGSAVAVRPGETLRWIAMRCRTTVAALLRANPQITNPNVIRAGQVIRMPGALAGQPPRLDPPGVPPSQPSVPPFVPVDLRVTGTVTREGVSCPALRGDDGRLYTLAGIFEPLRPGERVDVIGREARSSICMQGTTIQVRQLNRLDELLQAPASFEITGTLTWEGATCPAMRGDDGRLYTLAGDIEDFEPGDRVQVQGRRAEMSICMQGTTIEIRRIRPAR